MSYKTDIDIQSRGYYYAPSGDDGSDGRSLEVPKRNIQTALDAAQALVPPPSSPLLAQVIEAQGGLFIEDLVLYDFVLVNATQSTIISTGLVGVEAASFLSFNVQTLVNRTDNSVLMLIDGEQSYGSRLSACFIDGVNATGYKITGVCDELFLGASQFFLRGVGQLGYDITSESETPIDINHNTVILAANNQTLMHFDPVNLADSADMNISSLTVTNGATGTAGFKVSNGVLKIRGGSLESEMVGEALGTGTLSVNANALAGNSICRAGGAIVYEVGIIFGDMEAEVGGSLQWSGVDIFGNATNAGNMSIVCAGFVGEIVNTGSMYVEIGNYTGILPDNDGGIDGIINGVRYGNWVVDILHTITTETDTKLVLNPNGFGGVEWIDPLTTNREEVLNAASLVDQIPVGLDTPLQIEFGAAQGSSSTPVELDVNGATTINENNQFTFRVIVQYGRTAAGGASWLFFRVLKNAEQLGNSVFAKQDSSNSDIPVEVIVTMDVLISDVITFEFVRDSQGNNSGELVTETPTLVDWNTAPSASLIVSKSRLDQPVNLIAFLPGSSGDYFSTPDSVAASITGDLDIQMRVSATDWTPSPAQTIISKWDDPGNQKSYLFQISNTGALRIFLSEDGVVTLGPAISSVVTGFTDNTLHWVRFTWDQASGDVDFYTSEDNTDDASFVRWTALGVTQSLTPSAIFDSTSGVEVGGHNAGADANFDGSVSRASIFNGAALVVDFNPQDYEGGTTFTSAETGELWTLNGNASIEK